MEIDEIDALVQEFVALRDKKSEVTAKAKDVVSGLERKMSDIESRILELMGDGIESIRTRNGTAYKSLKRQTSVAGWDDFLPWIKETDNWHMLTRAANKAAVIEYLEEEGELPPGINLYSQVAINVRKGT